MLLTLLLLLAGCGSGEEEDAGPDPGTDGPNGEADEPDEPYELTVAMASPGIPFLQFDVAREMGFYEEHNLVIEEIAVEGSAAATAAVESGQADLMVSLPEGIVTARSAGSDLTMIGATVDENLYKLFVRDDISSLDDLVGEEIAMFVEGNGTHIQPMWLLDEHGPGADQATFVAVGGLGARLAAVQEGQVAATLLFPPFDVRAEREGITPLIELGDFVDGYPNEVISARRTVLDEKPEAFRAFMAAMEDATEWLLDDANTEAAIDLAVEVTGDDRDIVEEAFLFTQPTFATRIRMEGLEWTLEVMERYIQGFELPEIGDLYDDSFHP